MIPFVLAILALSSSGNISVSRSNGNLVLVGDAEDNALLVTTFNVDLVWLLPLGSTTLNGQQGWQYWYLERGDASGDVLVSLGSGDDELQFGRNLPRGFVADLGTGMDVARGEELFLQFCGIYNAERVEIFGHGIGNAKIFGAESTWISNTSATTLEIGCTAGDDEVWLDQMMDARITVRAGAGDDVVRLSSRPGLFMIGPSLLDGGQGFDTFIGTQRFSRLTLGRFETYTPRPWFSPH